MGEVILHAAEEISVVDVYDLATNIGKECEKIIDLYGADAVTSLMPKVINALELLEALANRNESENSKMQKLTDRIAYLESEKQERAVFRERFQKELEAIEEQWRNERIDLVALVNRLQEENRRIQKLHESPSHESSVNGSEDDLISKDDSQANLLSASDFQMMQRLRSQIEKQREEIKSRDEKLQLENNEIESLTIQLERLKTSGRESRKRQKLLQLQIRSLVEERADFLAQLQDQHREILSLKKSLGMAEKENEDLSWESAKYQDQDSDQARFTTTELKEILNERDNLKAQICDLEAELKLYRPTEEDSSPEEESIAEDDPPVQGPLPYEPDDAPWKKSSESGIKKFFRKLFSEPGSSTRRSFSSLSKMALSASPNSNTSV